MPRNRDDGLREDELASLEATFGFRFPSDLRAFLRDRPPLSQWDRSVLTVRIAEREAGESLAANEPPPPEDEAWGWMDWRETRAEIEARLASPFEGIAAYVRESAYWCPQWGTRPAALEDRMQLLANAPVLIPIGGQHYMAAEPSDAGNPIFSISAGCAIDVIVAGCDLADYLAGGPRSAATRGDARHIRFWSDLLATRT